MSCVTPAEAKHRAEAACRRGRTRSRWKRWPGGYDEVYREVLERRNLEGHPLTCGIVGVATASAPVDEGLSGPPNAGHDVASRTRRRRPSGRSTDGDGGVRLPPALNHRSLAGWSPADDGCQRPA